MEIDFEFSKLENACLNRWAGEDVPRLVHIKMMIVNKVTKKAVGGYGMRRLSIWIEFGLIDNDRS